MFKEFNMKTPAILLAGLMSAACVSGGYNPTYRFNQLQVVNLTGASVRNVEAHVLESEKTIRCDEVNNNGICNERFGSRRYPQQGVRLSWTHTDGSSKSEVFNPSIPVTYFNSFPLRIVMEIGADATVKAFYEQDEPSGPIFDP
jgi:hypothetical protein